MNCVRFEMRLDELLDDRSPPDSDAGLSEHAETCPHCAQLLADHQALLEAIEVLVRPETRGDLAGRILAEATREAVPMATVSQRARTALQAGAAQPSLLRAATWVAATIAAALLIGVGVREWSRPHQAAPVAESKGPDIDARDLAIEKPDANRAAEHRVPLGMQSVAESQSLAGPIGIQKRTLMEQMTDGLKPVTHSMSAAWNALLRTLPGSETPAHSS